MARSISLIFRLKLVPGGFFKGGKRVSATFPLIGLVRPGNLEALFAMKNRRDGASSL